MVFVYPTVLRSSVLKKVDRGVAELKKSEEALSILNKYVKDSGIDITKPSGPALNPESMPSNINPDSTFAELIEKLSGDGSLYRVNKLSLEKTEELEGVVKSTFSLEMETSFSNLGSFIEKLEGSPFLLEITQVDVLRRNKELRRCVAKIQINSYLQRKEL